MVIQAPASAGPLSATGRLGVDAEPDVGFDIDGAVRDDTAVELRARASLSVGDSTALYDITLFNGRASSLGTIGSKSPVVDIAIPLNQVWRTAPPRRRRPPRPARARDPYPALIRKPSWYTTPVPEVDASR